MKRRNKMAEQILQGKGTVIKKASEMPSESTTGRITIAIDTLIDESKKAGYASVLDYVTDCLGAWTIETDQACIRNAYLEYLEVIQNHQQKPHPHLGRWSVQDTFVDYLTIAVEDLNSKIKELNWKLKSKYPSFPRVVPYLKNMTDVPAGVGEPISKDMYNKLEMIFRKTQEAYRHYANNEIKLNTLLNQFNQEAKERATGDIVVK
jgi:hypothetical protein